MEQAFTPVFIIISGSLPIGFILYHFNVSFRAQTCFWCVFLHYLLASGIPKIEEWGPYRQPEDPGVKEDPVTQDPNKDPNTENTKENSITEDPNESPTTENPKKVQDVLKFTVLKL